MEEGGAGDGEGIGGGPFEFVMLRRVSAAGAKGVLLIATSVDVS
jgi:hypothetical protein